MSICKMAAKLIVQRFEEGTNFKYLHITINNTDSDNFSNAEFGAWSEGKSDYNKRDYPKPRLVVKLVSGDDDDNFSLELCAKKLEDAGKYYNWNSLNYRNLRNGMISKDILLSVDSSSCAKYDNNINLKTFENGDFFNALEHSIEKVKENNARIMENIHMLNRTLNYARKKEILDIICPKPHQSFPCEACGKCFVYETGLRRHYAMRHAVTEPHPRWQVVWTCTECFQVWPRHDLAIKHTIQCCSQENSECVREIKTSSLLQCEFCERVFTNIPRLLKHSKTHTVASNYECRTCSISLISYKLAEQHWLSCMWVNNLYKFSLPKMLLCNVCDRKFKNYEQLYNHRYKVGHFIAKCHNEHNGISLSMLLYQCEVCSQWYHEVQALLIHKNQQHSYPDTAICCI